MNARSDAHQSLRLEALETRTLLAADLADPFGLVADLNLAMHAVSGTGDFQANFDTSFGNHLLVLTGSSTSSLSIDLSQLPSFITNLSISSFGDVKMVGTDHVDNLILTSIGSVAASGLSVNQYTVVAGVDSLSIASLGTQAVLDGADMKLTATSLDGTSILSDLHSLTLTSDSKFVSYTAQPQAGWTGEQTLTLTFVPEKLGIGGISESSVHVLPGVSDNTSTPPVTTPNDGLTPDTPTDPSSSGSVTTGTTPSTDPNHLVIVSTTLDERTRELLDQLFGLLHSSQDNAQQQALDLLNHASLSAGHSTNSVPSVSVPVSDTLNLSAMTAWNHGNGEVNSPLIGQLNTPKLAEPLIAEQHFDANLGHFVATSSEEPSVATLPDGLVVKDVTNVDVTWPVLVATGLPEATRVSATHKADDHELTPVSVADSVRALGSYIVERVVAEFSPGQQSLVLLVDPQPSRPAGTSKKPSVESSPLTGLEVPTSDLTSTAA